MEDKATVTCVALIVLGMVELGALIQGIDGQLLMVVLVILAGAVGVPIGLRARDRVSF